MANILTLLLYFLPKIKCDIIQLLLRNSNFISKSNLQLDAFISSDPKQPKLNNFFMMFKFNMKIVFLF